MTHNREDQELLNFLNDVDLSPAMITAMLNLGGLPPTRDMVNALLEYRENNAFTSASDILNIPGFEEKCRNALLRAVRSGGYQSLSNFRIRKYLEVWDAPLFRFANTNFFEIELNDIDPVQMPPPHVAFVVVNYEDWFWVFDREEITSVQQIEQIRYQENPRLICSGVPVEPDMPARQALRRLDFQHARIFVLVKNGNVEGIVTPGNLFTPQPILASAEIGFSEDANWEKEPPAENFKVIKPQEPYRCALLVYKVNGNFGKFVDLLTGEMGYSHTAVDCCERDVATNRPLMIDTTLPNGVHRKYLDSPFYSGRYFYRIELNPKDSKVIYENLHPRLGRTFDLIDFWNDNGPDDPAGSICSQNAYECLPSYLQSRVQAAISQLNLNAIARRFHQANPVLVSPNQIARAFGAPNAHTV